MISPEEARTVMGILSWILIGLIVGALAKWLMPGPDPGGLVITTALGIVGALVGGAIASAVGLGGFTGFNLSSLVVAVAGAMLLLFVHRKLRSR
jgi:uncharacterized membrane protein YeaQ/YmgE (transglycosylase-associated protein family)